MGYEGVSELESESEWVSESVREWEWVSEFESEWERVEFESEWVWKWVSLIEFCHFQMCRLSDFDFWLHGGQKSSLIDSIFVAPRGIFVHVRNNQNNKLEF